MITLDDIRAARHRMGTAVLVSPCAFSHMLSEELGARLFFKLENLQLTGSFKERGACNKLSALGAQAQEHGVIAASAGNHAQGVAYHARRLGISATIVMPRSTPLIKLTSTESLGAELILFGRSYDEAHAEAKRLAGDTGKILVHPFDDPLVIAGQGTIGLELLHQVPNLEAVVVSVGGGGLAAGIATAVKETDPKVKVYGVEASAVPSMRAALDAGHPVSVSNKETIADGIAVGMVGAEPFEIARRYLDDLVTVEEEEIAEAILLLLEKEKTVVEGAGAAPLAALRQSRLPVSGKTVAVVLSGGNIDVNVLSRIIERGLEKSGRLMRVHVKLPDIPGSLARLLKIVAEHDANILEVLHDRAPARLEFGQCAVELVAETRGFDHRNQIQRAIQQDGFELDPLS